jgi:protease secretion system membrane fusion protein
MDEGVPAQGLVSIDTKRKTIQHLQGGIVKEVLIKEGEQVQEGQILMTLEQAVVKANLESVRQHYQSLRAAESRLLAEQSGKQSIQWHSELTLKPIDTGIQQHLLIQQQLFTSRRASLQANLTALSENLGGQEAMMVGAQRMLVQRALQKDLIAEELSGIRSLVKEGYAPRNREIELERNHAEMTASIADIESTIVKLQRGQEEMKQRISMVTHEYRKEVENQLADIRREVQADAEKLNAVSQDMERSEIKSPASGQVVGLAVQTIGAVISPGQRILDIVPSKPTLVIEAKVSPHLIDRMKPGQFADVRFSAFAHSPQLVVQSQIQSISGDLLNDPDTRQSYYLARLIVTPEGMKSLGDRSMQAGMMAEVVIRTGERSLLTYLAYPLVRRLAQSMKEE